MSAGREARPLSERDRARVLRDLAAGRRLETVARAMNRTRDQIRAELETMAESLETRARETGSSVPPTRVTIRADGAARGNPGQAGVGWVVEADGETLLEGGRYIGQTTNNVAEYEAVLAGVEAALALGAREAHAQLDSELVVRQITGEYRVRDAKLIECHARLRKQTDRFSKWSVSHIPRKQNARADELANRAIDEAEAAAGRTRDPRRE